MSEAHSISFLPLALTNTTNMKYLEFTFTITPTSEAAEDVLADVLAGVGFDSFVRTDQLEYTRQQGSVNPEAPEFVAVAPEAAQFKAYIPAAALDMAASDAALADFPLPSTTITYQQAEADNRDWNEEWEKNYFQPLVIGNRCVVAGTFHHDVPEAAYRITIDPRMSFGTGHHATTAQMLCGILDDDMTDLEVLDMGCGTSILAILARMRGARHCLAIDNDEWCVDNSLENIRLNGMDQIDVLLGDANTLTDKGPFDLVIANINRNILVRDLPMYVSRMRPHAIIYMSGFYVDDVPVIQAKAEECGLRLVDVHSEDGWACVKFARG